MERQEAFERIRKVLADYAPCVALGDITERTDLLSETGMDSIDSIDFIMDLEDEFVIDINDADANRLFGGYLDRRVSGAYSAPVSRFVDYVLSRTQSQPAI